MLADPGRRRHARPRRDRRVRTRRSVAVASSVAAGDALGDRWPRRSGVLASPDDASVDIVVAVPIRVLGPSEDGPGGLVSRVPRPRRAQRPARHPGPVNRLIEPSTMAARVVLLGVVSAGPILPGAAPCTALVFCGSSMSRDAPSDTLAQVSVDHLPMVRACEPGSRRPPRAAPPDRGRRGPRISLGCADAASITATPWRDRPANAFRRPIRPGPAMPTLRPPSADRRGGAAARWQAGSRAAGSTAPRTLSATAGRTARTAVTPTGSAAPEVTTLAELRRAFAARISTIEATRSCRRRAAMRSARGCFAEG